MAGNLREFTGIEVTQSTPAGWLATCAPERPCRNAPYAPRPSRGDLPDAPSPHTDPRPHPGVVRAPAGRIARTAAPPPRNPSLLVVRPAADRKSTRLNSSHLG